ncbi:flagellar protein export ATPase FliI [Candidatus Omnitrophota bacterium]
MINTTQYKKYSDILDAKSIFSFNGRVEQVAGLCIEANGPCVSVGDACFIDTGDRANPLQAEVVGFKDNRVFLMPLGDMRGLQPGAMIYSNHESLSIPVGEELLGRVINGFGEPLDDKGPLLLNTKRSIKTDPPNPMQRKRILEPLSTGIRAIDALLTIGKGQRMGIFSGSGVGKSSLLGMIARYTNADVSVIALVGERGREVREFIEKDLGEEGLKKSVVIVETGDKPPLRRLNAALAATTIAEYFRDQGKDIILMMDSVTRVAMAQREVGLTVGEPPATKGFTPSVFSFLPKLLERSGSSEKGTITGFYTVLVEADDFNEPISDAARSILDGHIVLTRELASMNHYPAIDVLESISRVMQDIALDENLIAAQKVREILAAYKEAEDLINIGAYVKGSNPKIDFAISKIEDVRNFLMQPLSIGSSFAQSITEMKQIVETQDGVNE